MSGQFKLSGRFKSTDVSPQTFTEKEMSRAHEVLAYFMGNYENLHGDMDLLIKLARERDRARLREE